MSSHTPGSPLSSSQGPSPPRRTGIPFHTKDGSNTSSPSAGSNDGPSSKGSVRRKERHGGFLLDSFARRSRNSAAFKRSGSLKGKEKEEEGEPFQQYFSHLDTPQRHSVHEYSPSIGSSPLASQVASIDGDAAQDERKPTASRRRPMSHSPFESQRASQQTNPAVLVNLALQLSQSRARTASARFNPHLANATGSVSGRVVSLGTPMLPQQSNLRPRENGLHATSSPVAPIKAGSEEVKIAPGAVITNGLATQHVDSNGPGLTSDLDNPGTVQFLPSPQTIIRAERAQIALELRYHHRRLLQYIPRLPISQTKKQRSNTVTSERNKAEIDITVHNVSNSLGQQYNPLQYARNRRVRHRLYKSLDGEAQGWKDLDAVRAWVDDVAAASESNLLTSDGHVLLPCFEPSLNSFLNQKGDSFDGHDAVPTKARSTLPRSDWTNTPWDLLADTYWLQQDDNRSLIEDYNGDKIYPRMSKQFSANDRPKQKSKYGKAIHSHTSSVDGPVSVPPTSNAFIRVLSDEDISSAGKNTRGSPMKISNRASSHHKSRVKRFSKRLSRAQASSSSSDDSDEDHKRHRPWAGTFGQNWHGTSIPDRELIEKRRAWPNDLDTARSSTEIPFPNKTSKEVKRPFSLELHPPKDGNKGGKDVSHRRHDEPFSDLDSTAPSSPAHTSFAPSLVPDFDPKKIFGSNAGGSRSSVAPKDRYHGIQRKDFADDPFHDGLPESKRNGFHSRTRSRVRTTTLSSPSESSISAGSDDRPRSSLQSNQHDRPLMTPDRELGFHPLRTWKGGNFVGRARGLLRRKELGSDVSDTDDESLHRRTRSPLPAAPKSVDEKIGIGEISDHVTDSPQYKALDLPTFRSARQNDSPSSKEPQRPSLAAPYRPNGGSTRAASERLTAMIRGTGSPDNSISPALSVSGEDERSRNSSESQSRQPSQRRGTNERRGATVTDDAGQQWPLKKRTDAPPWPGQDRGGQLPNILWTGPELSPSIPGKVTKRDLARTEAVLVSAIYKANCINKRYKSLPSKPTSLLKEIRTFDSDQAPISRIQEPRILAEHLAAHIDAHRSATNAALNKFATDSLPALDAKYIALKDHIQDELTDKVQAACDRADELGATIAMDRMLEIKELNDRIDMIWRKRRRRSRWLRRIVFSMLEWAVLTIMWVLWFLVVCFKLLSRALTGTMGAIRWLLWLD